MKSYFIIAILTSFVCMSSFAQDTVSKQTIGLDPPTFKKVLNQQFSNLITGQSKNSIGNFASLDLKEPEVSFAGNSIFKNGSVLSTKASGGVTDGFFSIFNNSTLNTKISLDVQYNFLNLKNKSLTYYDDSFQVYKEKKNKILNQHKVKLIEVENEQGKTLLILKEQKLKELKTDLEDKFSREKVTPRKDSIKYEIEITDFKIDSIATAIKNYPLKDDLEEEVNNWKAVELKKLKPEIQLYGFNFGWFSIGYKVQNNSFKLFNPSLQFSNQITDTSFVSHEARFQYSRYKWSVGAYESYFWCAGIAFSYSDNLSDLSKTEVTEIKNYGTNPNDRTTTKKYNAYTGNYLGELKGLRLFADYYRFLFNENTAAIHTYPELQVKDNTKPIYNLGFGFLYSFKDSKDETSIVNAELYYNFLDLFKSTETTYKLFERNNIGLRFTFPIKFKTK
jgi:hypothetical protein